MKLSILNLLVSLALIYNRCFLVCGRNALAVGKTTYQRTSNGPVAIGEVSPEGTYIMLENTSSGPSRQDVTLDGWKLKRNVDGLREYVYIFRNFVLKPGKTVKILARGSAPSAGLNDLVFREEDNWGVGNHVTIDLVNPKDEIKASFVQKTFIQDDPVRSTKSTQPTTAQTTTTPAGTAAHMPSSGNMVHTITCSDKTVHTVTCPAIDPKPQTKEKCSCTN